MEVLNLETMEEAQTPAELRRMLGDGRLILATKYSRIIEDRCLCQIDVEATMRALGWDFAIRGHDPFAVEVRPPKSSTLT